MVSEKAKEKSVNITVNTQPHVVEKDHITYEEVVGLAGEPVPIPEGVVYQVTYTPGNNDSNLKTLPKGGSVKAKEGMDFFVDTGNRS